MIKVWLHKQMASYRESWCKSISVQDSNESRNELNISIDYLLHDYFVFYSSIAINPSLKSLRKKSLIFFFPTNGKSLTANNLTNAWFLPLISSSHWLCIMFQGVTKRKKERKDEGSADRKGAGRVDGLLNEVGSVNFSFLFKSPFRS